MVMHLESPSTESQSLAVVDYKKKYTDLKRRLHTLIYENELLKSELTVSQRKLLKVVRDKTFLLDRLVAYEQTELISSGDETESSDGDIEHLNIREFNKSKRKTDIQFNVGGKSGMRTLASKSQTATSKRTLKAVKRAVKVKTKTTRPKKAVSKARPLTLTLADILPSQSADLQHMTVAHLSSEEVERHLEARPLTSNIIPERTPLTVPSQMFSNESEIGECLKSIDPSPSTTDENLTMDYTD